MLIRSFLAHVALACLVGAGRCARLRLFRMTWAGGCNWCIREPRMLQLSRSHRRSFPPPTQLAYKPP